MAVPVRKAVIPVAGLGTRFLPQTKAFPKEMLPILDRPVIQYIVEEAVNAGIEEIIFVISEDKRAIQRYFEQNEELEQQLLAKGKQKEYESIAALHTMAKFHYVLQDAPLGLGHAVMQTRELIGNEPFVVFGGDDVIESEIPGAKQLIDVYTGHEATVLGVIEVPEKDVVRYGIIDPQGEVQNSVMRAQGIIEKPEIDAAPSHYGVCGRWLVTPDIFEYLERVQPDASGEIQITEALKLMATESAVYARVIDGVYRDCGNKTEYLKAVIASAIKDPELGDEISSYIKTLGV